MIEEISVHPPKTIGFLVKGRLTEEDYTMVLIPGIERGIDEFSKVGVLLQVEDFKGWTPGGAWEDFKTWPKFRHVPKLAMVSDKSWDEFLTMMSQVFLAFTHTELRFYRAERIAEAWEWLGTEK
jgi:Protein of unknown function (DUF3478).